MKALFIKVFHFSRFAFQMSMAGECESEKLNKQELRDVVFGMQIA
jgi:hypothetical protein